MDEFKTELWIIAAMLPFGALAGFAALLRSNEEVTRRAVAGAMLNSSLFSAGFCALMFWAYGSENLLLNIGMSVMAGLGGNTAVGFGMKMWRSAVSSQLKNDEHDSEN